MVDKKLIDYSVYYKDYKKTLQEDGQHFALEDMMALVEGFLTNCTMDLINNKDKEALINLGKAHNSYRSY